MWLNCRYWDGEIIQVDQSNHMSPWKAENHSQVWSERDVRTQKVAEEWYIAIVDDGKKGVCDQGMEGGFRKLEKPEMEHLLDPPEENVALLTHRL